MVVKALVMVEGISDKVLVELLVKKLELNQKCEVVTFAETKEGFIGITRAQLNNPVACLVLLKDLEEMDEANMAATVENALYSLEKVKGLTQLQWRFSSGATFHLIPVGLPDDPNLKSLGIRRHTMESHLLRFIFDHPEKCVHERTGHLIDDPQSLLNQILPIVRRHDPPLDSAKDVFQVLRGILGWTGGPRDWLNRMLRDVSVESEPAFKMLCTRLKQAIVK